MCVCVCFIPYVNCSSRVLILLTGFDKYGPYTEVYRNNDNSCSSSRVGSGSRVAFVVVVVVIAIM